MDASDETTAADPAATPASPAPPRPAKTGPRLNLSALAGNLGSGTIVAFVNAAYSLSFALLIFSGPLADGLSAGVATMVFSAGLATLIAAAFSSYPFAVAGPDTASMAVMSAMVVGITTGATLAGGDANLLPHVILALTMTTLVTGITLFAIGALKLDVWMRYIPFPVMGGFLAAAGCLLTAGAIKVATGQTLTASSLPGLVEPASLAHVAAGVACAATIVAMRRLWRHFLVLPAALLAQTAIVHAVIAGFGVPLAQARAETWILPSVSGAGSVSLWMVASVSTFDWTRLLSQGGEIAAAAGVTAFAILLTTTGLEVTNKAALDLNRELRVSGLSNILLGAAGSVLGNLTFNRTALNVAAGARSRWSGAVAGSLCLGLAFAEGSIAGFVPTPVLSGLLFYMGFGLLRTWLVSGWRRLSRSDYVLVVAIMTLIVTRGYLEGIVLGLIASCLIFALNYSRVRIVKHRLTRQQTSSYVERSLEEQTFLTQHGGRVQVLWLQGYLFFGTAHGLLETLTEWITQPARAEPASSAPTRNRRTRGRPAMGELASTRGAGTQPRFLVIDFRQVTGADSSAAFSFLKLRDIAESHGVKLVFSSLAPNVRAPLAAEGLWSDGQSRAFEFPDLDMALEWAEDRLLDALDAGATPRPDFDAWLARELGGKVIAERFKRYLEPIGLDKGSRLFAQGNPADALFFLRSGRVSVILDRQQSAPIRLRSMTGHTVIGEMGLYRDASRIAAVVADMPSEVFRLSKASFRRMEEQEPDLSSAFHAMIVRILADRLSFASNEIAALLR